jgi:type II secretion system (T2SS) protein E
MSRLGAILVAMGACSREQVREALDAQVLLGGRLGTNLLDLGGAVAEEALARALAQQHGVRALHGELVPDPAALALLRPAVADRAGVVPYQVSARRLAVLCPDPRDVRTLDEIAFATGKIVEPIVVPEARLWALLRAHYGADRPLRGIGAAPRTGRPAARGADGGSPDHVPDLMAEADFQALYADRVACPVPPTSPPTPTAPPTSPPTPTPTAPPPPVRPERRAAESKRERAPPPPDPFGGAFVTSDEVLAALQSEARAAAPERAPLPLAPVADTAAPLSYGAAVSLLAGVADRGEIARVVLRFARSRFRRALLLTVHGRGADGWEGIGDGLTPQTVARVHVSLDGPGVVRTVVDTRSHVLGPLQKTEANLALLRALAGGAPKSAFAMPILARGQVVNVLYADAGRGGHVNPDGVGELLILAAKIAQSYDALLARAR